MTFNVGDRVVLKRWYADMPDVKHYDRDGTLGPRAKDAIGTVTADDGHGSTVVAWDDPTCVSIVGPHSSWSTGWFDPAPLPPVDTSTIEAVEEYLNAP